ncbi:MAG TPA: glycosyltransferase, partial [Blastocatellia bacterium]|nr:glycosyltransferase [Blastocatellia bacterium]
MIPSWNGLELLERFLPSVIAAAVQYSREFEAPTEIVIVDDGSVDQTADWLSARGFVEGTERSGRAGEQGTRGPGVNNAGQITNSESEASINQPLTPILKLIRNEVNRGFGPTCNRGFESARYPLVFLLNNDVDVDVNAIAPLVENFTDASVFAAHCRVFDLESGRECGSGKVGSFSSGFIRVHRSYVIVPGIAGAAGMESGEQTVPYSMFASGGSAMFDRRGFLEIGGFDSLLAPIYWEDVDISYRAWKRGLSVLYEPRSVVHHRVSSTMRKANQRSIRRGQQRNRLIYHWVNLHDGPLMALHLMWVALLALTAPLRLQPGFLLSVAAALKKLRQIRKRRLEEKMAARRSDRDVFDIFTSLEKRPDIFAYDDYAEL